MTGAGVKFFQGLLSFVPSRAVSGAQVTRTNPSSEIGVV
jgi:hypothetical protein